MIEKRDAAYRDELAKLTPGLRRFARALVENHNSDSADDLVQGALVAALAESQDRRGPRLHLWLLGTIASHHRRGLRVVTVDRHVNAGTGGAHGAAGKDRWHSVQRPSAGSKDLLGDLPLDCREVFLLVAVEELTYVQTAECLGLTLNGVITNLAKAREQLSRNERWSEARVPAHRATGTVPHASYLRVVK